ncbi:MAG: M23 family metallopeptidase [Pelagibacteraceae bacterium]
MIYRFLIFFFFVGNAYAIDLNGNFTQGGLIIGKVSNNEIIYLNNKKLKVSPEGYFIFGISRNQTRDLKIKIESPLGNEIIVKKIKKRKFKIQRIDGLPDKQVNPGPNELKQIKKETEVIKEAKNIDSNLIFFYQDFIKPLSGIKTGIYGSQRIINGQKRTPHYGIDIAAAIGTPVVSPNDGRVILAKKNMFFTGNTIMIDHGHGLISIFSHLDQIQSEMNEIKKKGDVIGTVGKTGRVTGPHLHYGIYWKNIGLDPDLIFKNN